MATKLSSSNQSHLLNFYNLSQTHGHAWKALFLLVVLTLDSCHGQTFQYSRGWTNGKRSGGSGVAYSGTGSGQIYDVEGSVVGSSLDDTTSGVPALHVNLSPEGRPRVLDFNPLLSRKLLSSRSYSRKQPLWVGTILGLEGQENNSANNPEF